MRVIGTYRATLVKYYYDYSPSVTLNLSRGLDNQYIDSLNHQVNGDYKVNKSTVPDNRFMVAELITANNTYDKIYVKTELITEQNTYDEIYVKQDTEQNTCDEIDVSYSED